jgi:hypothetical protein
VEPHELLLADARTLLIAHGGRSDTLRGDAGLPDARCESTLTWLDIASAKPIAEHRPADARISLRHLARVRDGAFLIGAQSDAERVLPMLALATPAALHTLPSEPALRENYIASVASDGVALAACAERDGCALRFADASATPATQPMGRVDGAAFVDGVLWLSRVDGRLYRCATRLQPAREFRYERIVWDNHLSVIDLA